MYVTWPNQVGWCTFFFFSSLADCNLQQHPALDENLKKTYILQVMTLAISKAVGDA